MTRVRLGEAGRWVSGSPGDPRGAVRPPYCQDEGSPGVGTPVANGPRGGRGRPRGNRRTTGQGRRLSPILANVHLVEVDRKTGSRHALARYADDIVVRCATSEEARGAARAVKAAMNEEEPKLKPEKIRIVPLAAGVATLGYRISAVMARPSERSVKQLQGKFRSLTERHETRRLAEGIPRVMSMARGWAHYFRLAGRSPVLDEIGKWILARRKAYATQRH